MNDEILMFLEKEYGNWLNEVEKDAYDHQHYYTENGKNIVKTRNALFEQLIENRKKYILEETRKKVLSKLTKEEIEILGL